MLHTSWGSATDKGRVRALNEDSLLARPPVFVVADGMGGHEAGDLASGLVVEEFGRLVGRRCLTTDQIDGTLSRAADRLRTQVAGRRVAGTTVAGVAIADHDDRPYWLVFNIGDSRVYRYAAGGLHQISVDHSVVQELIDRGEIDADAAARHPERHVITRAVGTGPLAEADYWLLPAHARDRMLVCSDGLVNELDERTVTDALERIPDSQQAAQWLVSAAVARGGRDNVSVVVVDAAIPEEEDFGRTAPRGRYPGRRRTLEPEDRWEDEIYGTTVPQWLKVGRP